MCFATYGCCHPCLKFNSYFKYENTHLHGKYTKNMTLYNGESTTGQELCLAYNKVICCPKNHSSKNESKNHTKTCCQKLKLSNFSLDAGTFL